MTMTGEYHTGMIRSSLMAVPRRLPVLWSKLLVFSAVTLALMVAGAFIGFLGAQAIFAEHHVNATLGSAHALRAIFGAALVSTATGAMCIALGTIVRRTAGGIALFVGVFYVLPGLVEILPAATVNAVAPYLPSTVTSGLAQALAQPNSFTPWGGFALFCGYTAVVIVIAALLLERRDA